MIFIQTHMTPSIKNITEWDRIDSSIDSQWGKLKYGDWCEKEAARMRAKGGTAIVVRIGDKCAIARDTIASRVAA